MRVLFTFSGGSGHLDPLLPLARAAAARGHAIAFAARPWMVPKVEAAGFDAFASGTDIGLEPVTRPLLEVDMERELRDLRDGFGRAVARERARDLLSICRDWAPDVVAWDETDFGAPIVAERLGLRHASVVVIASGSFVAAAGMADALDEVRIEHGLPPDPETAMLHRHLVLSPVPPSFRDPAYPPPATLRPFRPWDTAPTRRPGPPPAWASRLPRAPVVYFTLGTVFNHESGDLFPRALAGLRELRANVLVTVGRELDPAALGPQPPHVTVERFVPQADVLPYADAVISHGGSGSVLGALAHGLPVVALAMGADQPLNAGRLVALGAGIALDAVRATPAEIRDATAEVLADPLYGASAGALRMELEALPPADAAVGWLEEVATTRAAPPSRTAR